MSEAVIFQIGAVVFVAVTAAVFLFGMSVFREWQSRDDDRADVGHSVDTSDGVSVAITADETSAEIVPIDHAPTPRTGVATVCGMKTRPTNVRINKAVACRTVSWV